MNAKKRSLMRQQPALVVARQRRERLIFQLSLAPCAMEAWKKYQLMKTLQKNFDVESAGT